MIYCQSKKIIFLPDVWVYNINMFVYVVYTFYIESWFLVMAIHLADNNKNMKCNLFLTRCVANILSALTWNSKTNYFGKSNEIKASTTYRLSYHTFTYNILLRIECYNPLVNLQKILIGKTEHTVERVNWY